MKKVKSKSVGAKNQTKSVYNKAVGFTLLEVLLAMFLGMLVIGVILQNYLSIKNVYQIQNQLMQLGDNIRLADFILRQNIMYAGFSGWRKISELNLINHLGEIWEFVPIYGYDNAQGPQYLLNKIEPNSDVVVITKINSDISNVIKSDTSEIHVGHNPTTATNQFLLISDGKNAEIFKAANGTNRKVIITLNKLNYSYQTKNSYVGRLEKIAFFISKPTNSSIKSLYYQINDGKKEELIPEISDMEIIYGVDLQGQGRVTNRLKATPITELDLWNKVLSIEITLTPQNPKLAHKQWKIYIKLRER